ncbi:sel1 repeat family protein [Pseudoalteromonas luteoviolacea]|uniref:sel1 repeat family protein n=1 Tax=Pseudoalteromonas luteoviolacea TaxID=43657 RepID=UPI001B37FEDB|nr:sel1 repeat family protein [Pseudoalteromonas luteoviolacea]MBQ4836546.1 sel1 repeat family protein [Pseudoalteromonas luteoviolacea]
MKFIVLLILIVTTSVNAQEKDLAEEYYKIADQYYKQKGSKDFSPKKAYNLFLKGAELGHIPSKNMAYVVFNVYPKTLLPHMEEAVHHLVDAAKANSKQAQFNVGMILTQGSYMEKNVNLANKWLYSSALLGLKIAHVYHGINLVNQYMPQKNELKLSKEEYDVVVGELSHAIELKNVEGIVQLARFEFVETGNLKEVRRLTQLALDIGGEDALALLKSTEFWDVINEDK